MKVKVPLFLAFALALAHGLAVAEVLRWVDEQGRVNYGTSVPERYRQSARPVPVDTPPSDAQRREAEARLLKEREALTRPPAVPAASRDAAAPARESAAAPREATSCEAQWQAYDASWACFNPYRNKGGSVKGDAYEHCKEVAMPDCIR